MASEESDQEFLSALREKHESWTARWQALHSEPPDVVFHYTNAAALLGIVQDRQLWASNAAFLNDSTELNYIAGVLAEISEELRATYGVHEDIKAYAADAWAQTGRFPPEQRRAASVISILESTPDFPAGLFDVYVSCFCSNDDLLSQWRGYPPSSGGGYALGLRSASLPHGGGLLRRVIYDRDTQRQLLRDLLSPIVEAVVSPDYPVEENGPDPMHRLVREHLGPVAASIGECGFCFKHPGFEEEREWRLVVLSARDPKYRPNDPPPLFRATPTRLVPYMRRSLEDDAIAKVVVGPGAQPKLAADAAAQLLENAGYENADDIVKHSAIPLRV